MVKHNSNKKISEEKIKYCVRLFENQNSRGQAIERKIYPLINSSGLITSLLIIAISSFEVFENFLLFWKILIHILFLGAVTLFAICTLKAAKILNPKQFKYMDTSHEKTLDRNFKIARFMHEYIEDLSQSITNNRLVNDKKADILINSYKYFKFGIIVLTLLVILLVLVYCYPSIFDKCPC